MPSSVHRGDYRRMRHHMTIALLEAEVMEPRVQIAFARGEVPECLPANMGLVRLLLVRADQVTRATLDRMIATHYDIYADRTYTDRMLAESA
jgi:hypothetical protein